MRIVLVGLLILSQQCRVMSQSSLDYLIPGVIPEIKQQKENDCWITVTAMMISWREKRIFTVDDLLERFGDPWRLYYDLDIGLPAADQSKFTKLVRLTGEPPANYTLKAYVDLLKGYGPIWITTGDGIGAHARVLIGIKGTGLYDDTTHFILIDPFTGSRVDKGATSFLKEFEEEARVANDEGWKEDFRIQMYHF